MKGKEKCRALKELRQRIADENDIEYATRECSFQGECKGTCPKCEAELKYLEEQIENRQKLGKKVVLAGLSAGIGLSFCGCDLNADNVIDPGFYDLEGEATLAPIDYQGDVEYCPPDDGDDQLMGDVPDENDEVLPDGGELLPDDYYDPNGEEMGDVAFVAESVYDFDRFFDGTDGAKYNDKMLMCSDFYWSDTDKNAYSRASVSDIDNDGELEQIVEGPNGGFYLDYGKDEEGLDCLYIVLLEDSAEL